MDMSLTLLWKGFVSGFVISMPLGPIAILVIRRTVNKNFKSGFISAIGAASCDTAYALMSGFFMSYMISFIREYQTIIQIIGAIVLIILGVHIFRSRSFESFNEKQRKADNHLQHFITGFLIAVSNPAVIVMYIALFAGTGVVFHISRIADVLLFIGGFASGAMCWWTIVTASVNAFRHKFNLQILYWFNKLSGVGIILFVIVSAILIMINGSPEI